MRNSSIKFSLSDALVVNIMPEGFSKNFTLHYLQFTKKPHYFIIWLTWPCLCILFKTINKITHMRAIHVSTSGTWKKSYGLATKAYSINFGDMIKYLLTKLGLSGQMWKHFTLGHGTQTSLYSVCMDLPRVKYFSIWPSHSCSTCHLQDIQPLLQHPSLNREGAPSALVQVSSPLEDTAALEEQGQTQGQLTRRELLNKLIRRNWKKQVKISLWCLGWICWIPDCLQNSSTLRYVVFIYLLF